MSCLVRDSAETSDPPWILGEQIDTSVSPEHGYPPVQCTPTHWTDYRCSHCKNQDIDPYKHTDIHLANVLKPTGQTTGVYTVKTKTSAHIDTVTSTNLMYSIPLHRLQVFPM